MKSSHSEECFSRDIPVSHCTESLPHEHLMGDVRIQILRTFVSFYFFNRQNGILQTRKVNILSSF